MIMFWRLLFNGTGDLQNANSNVTPMTWDDYSNSEPDLFWTLHDYERCRKEAQETKALGHTELVETVKTLTGVVTRLEKELTETKMQHEEKLRELEMVSRAQNETIDHLKNSWGEVGDILQSQNEALSQQWSSMRQGVQDQAEKTACQEQRVSKLEEIIGVQKRFISNQEESLSMGKAHVRDKTRVFNQHQNTHQELVSTVQKQTLKLQQLENSLSELEIVNKNQDKVTDQFKKSWSKVGDIIQSQNEALSQQWSSILREVQDHMHVQAEKTARQEQRVSELEEIIEVQQHLISNQEESLSMVKAHIQDKVGVFLEHQNNQHELEKAIQMQTLNLQQVGNRLISLDEVVSELELIIEVQNSIISKSLSKGDVPAQNESIEGANNVVCAQWEKMSSQQEEVLKGFVKKHKKEVNSNIENMTSADRYTVRTHSQDTDHFQDSMDCPSSNTVMDMHNKNEIVFDKIKEGRPHMKVTEAQNILEGTETEEPKLKPSTSRNWKMTNLKLQGVKRRISILSCNTNGKATTSENSCLKEKLNDMENQEEVRANDRPENKDDRKGSKATKESDKKKRPAEEDSRRTLE